jgi:hypothetical protein
MLLFSGGANLVVFVVLRSQYKIERLTECAAKLFAKKGQFFNKLWSQHQLLSKRAAAAFINRNQMVITFRFFLINFNSERF